MPSLYVRVLLLRGAALGHGIGTVMLLRAIYTLPAIASPCLLSKRVFLLICLNLGYRGTPALTMPKALDR